MSKLCKLGAATVGALALTIGATNAFAAGEYSGMTLTVLGINTDINDVYMDTFGKKFEQDTGAKLTIVTGSAPGNLSKALVAKGKAPTFQVLLLEDPTQAQAVQAGVLQKLDYSKMPNAAKVVKLGFPSPGYGPALDFYRLGICINVDQYKAHNVAIPTSVEGLFDPAVKGHLILPTPTNFWWLTGMQALADNYKIPLSDPTPLFQRLADMQPSSLYTASGEAQAKLQSGEAWISPTSDGRCFALKIGGQPMEFIPLNLNIKGKTYRWIIAADTWDIPVGVTGKQLELAYKFIDYAIAPESELPVTKKFGYSPTSNEGMKLAMAIPEVQKAGVYDADFSFDNMYAPEASKLLPYTSKWLEIWNHMFVK